MTFRAKITKRIDLLLKVAVFILTYLYLYFEIFYNNTFYEINRILELTDICYASLIIVVMLMPLNWAIEAFKWRYTIYKIEPINYAQSFKSVLAGVAMGIFTPNRTGEIFGRALTLKSSGVWEASFAAAVNSAAQLLVTIVCGNIALVFYLVITETIMPTFLNLTLLISVATLFSSVLIWLYFNIKVLSSVARWKIFRNYRSFTQQIDTFKDYSAAVLRNLLALSFSRYLIFFAQFYLILNVFAVKLDITDAMILLPVCFLAITAVPTIALSEIGVRGSATIFIFGLYGALMDNASLNLVVATTLLWFINVVIPAVAGTFFLSSVNFRKNNC